MAAQRPCPWCKRKHSAKKAARACMTRHKGAPAWKKEELI